MNKPVFFKSLFKALGVECALFLFYGVLPYIDGKLDKAGLVQQSVFCLTCAAALTFIFYKLSTRKR